VHSRLGYIAYALGKALRAEVNSDAIWRAMSACALLGTLQGFAEGETYQITLATVFSHIRKQYPRADEIPPGKWDRYVAAVMFSSLNDDQVCDPLLEAVAHDREVPDLVLETQSGTINAGASDLVSVIRSTRIGDIQREKHSLYWIGNSTQQHMRGLYSLAKRYFESEIDILARHEQSVLASCYSSPYAKLAQVDESGDRVCVLEKLNDIGNSCDNSDVKEVVGKVMQSLYDGVLDAMCYLEGSHAVDIGVRTFYAHDIDIEPSPDSQAILRVRKTETSSSPRVSDKVRVGRHEYEIFRVDEASENWVLQLAPMSSRAKAVATTDSH
jgi:hypothetical protein